MEDDRRARELKERSRAAFDAQAATYDEGMEGDHARGLYPLVAEEVASAVAGKEGPRLLDLGCGTGALAELVLARVPGSRLSCVDLSPRMVADAEALPFPEESFDAAWCNDSFHHYPDPDRAAFSVWRALRPGGAFVVGDVWQPAPARALMNAWMPHSREGDVRIYSEGEMRAILGKWFDAVDWRRVGQTACVCVARKGRQGA